MFFYSLDYFFHISYIVNIGIYLFESNHCLYTEGSLCAPLLLLFYTILFLNLANVLVTFVHADLFNTQIIFVIFSTI